VFFAASGLPRMAGKILGWLMVCSPPYQTAEEIETALGASKGTVSTMTRLLMHMGLIEKVGIPDRRHAHFRLKEGIWAQVVSNESSQMRRLRDLAERGLGLLAETPSENQQRLQEMREMFTFFERELPVLLERFHRERMQNR
jgi:DNA-binding transcriptional regulator GbsR (MarR family)